jgi:hypothetical protein
MGEFEKNFFVLASMQGLFLLLRCAQKVHGGPELNMRKVKKQQTAKISKGYRLLPETHELIYAIQYQLNCDQDTAVNKACKKYFSYLKNKLKQ